MGLKNMRLDVTSPQKGDASWTVDQSEQLYRLAQWGKPYFSVNAVGHVTVSPTGDQGGSLDLFELVCALRQRNLSSPLLIRFPDILADRIERLHACFARAIARYNYSGSYRGVYPIKCNQHRQLLEALVDCGKPHKFGLEAGSKPELVIALATLCRGETGDDKSLLICNGYKDREYIETALLATRLGQIPILVLEQLEELPLVIELSHKLGIPPVLGVRVKLSSKGSGRWADSTGDRAKFGLSIPQLLDVINQLKSEQMLDCLQLLHFHIGSQISSISTIKDAIREASQVYGELMNLGANMCYLDVGGGLAVDYDGSKTNSPASKNYNMQNYANDIVAEVKEACQERQIRVPTLVSESGRAIASHQSVLIFDVLGTSDVPSPPSPPQETEHLIIHNLWETYTSINSENYQELYHDAIQFKEDAISLFNFGYLSLEERAKAEQLHWACCHQILEIFSQQEDIPEDFADLETMMVLTYYANLSVFRSAPDTWAIKQLFPIMPIHRLQEQPTHKGILADLTCDSDGKIDQFIALREVKEMLELHHLQAQQPYYLGMFLVGAYQEIMGNLHNLFGNVNTVHIQMTSQGYRIDQVVKGDTVEQVLGDVGYDAQDLMEIIRRCSEQALQENQIAIEEAQLLLKNYEVTLSSYTYLKAEDS